MKLFRFIIKQVVEIGLKEIIRMLIVRLIDFMKSRKELYSKRKIKDVWENNSGLRGNGACHLT